MGLTVYCAFKIYQHIYNSYCNATSQLLLLFFCQLSLILLRVGEMETSVLSRIMFLAAKQMDNLISLYNFIPRIHRNLTRIYFNNCLSFNFFRKTETFTK